MNKRAESRARYFTRKISQEKGWNVSHPSKGGDFLEEQEIISYFPQIGLGLNRPDFLVCLDGEPALVIETKNSFKKYQSAVNEAVEYCEMINATNHFTVKIAIGVAGDDENGFIVVIKYLKNGVWKELESKGNPITALLSKEECRNAICTDDYTTEISLPSTAQFIEAAIEISNILRKAKIEPTLRPKVVGAITTALYKGEIPISCTNPLEEINRLCELTINESNHFSEEKKIQLKEAILLGLNDYNRLSPYIFRIISILKRLNVRAVLQSDADFLGMFYEAFLRYGADNNAMGIVFTPRHITKLCIELAGVEIGHKIIDIACGTGGFLVSAFDSLKTLSRSDRASEIIKESIYGFDTNPTVWSLSCLNMFFRGDGKSHIENASSLEKESKSAISNQFNRAFLNPPFHQQGEPERDFIDASMDSLMQGGLFVGVIYAGVFADNENAAWRNSFIKKHTILGMISLPDELFYPNASAITTIIIAKAHVPQPEDSTVFMAKMWNDGFEKLKGKRVECRGSQMEEIKNAFLDFKAGQPFSNSSCTTIKASCLFNGEEFSPQQWIPQISLSDEKLKEENKQALSSLFQAITVYPDIMDSFNDSFCDFGHKQTKRFPLSVKKPLSYFFKIKTGKSKGLKIYTPGIIPYISSGDNNNGIVGLVNRTDEELCDACITVSAFGRAYLQPWFFMARGNGGSAVKVLRPKFHMTIRELLWFVSQINAQKWRFPYARQAIKTRLERLEIMAPDLYLDDPLDITEKLKCFKESLSMLSSI